MLKADSILEKIREERHAFRQSEQKVAEYILTHPREVIGSPITELAEVIGVSEATIVRMCKKIGFKGFHELKISLAAQNVQPLQTVHEQIQDGDDMETIVKKVFAANIQAMNSTLNVLPVRDLKQAVDALATANQIHFYGVGGSGSIAQDAAHKFMKTGKPVAAYIDTHMQVMAASLLGKGDVVVGISHSGSSRDIIEALELARKKGATTIGLTHYAKSPIDKVLDIKLCTASNETFYRTESTSSRIAQLSIIDALFIGVSLRDPEKAIENIQLTREAIASKRF
ncbi:MAG: MurR/RpiR family transcriptional regulator [Firmicutes bacterium]|nr:MurR/RpiR family transcriptional regulator [Bacillota bacterium]